MMLKVYERSSENHDLKILDEHVFASY